MCVFVITDCHDQLRLLLALQKCWKERICKAKQPAGGGSSLLFCFARGRRGEGGEGSRVWFSQFHSFIDRWTHQKRYWIPRDEPPFCQLPLLAGTFHLFLGGCKLAWRVMHFSCKLLSNFASSIQSYWATMTIIRFVCKFSQFC